MNKLMTFISINYLIIVIVAIVLILLVALFGFIQRRKRHPPQKSYSTLPHKEFKTGWILSGFDWQENTIHLAIDDTQLQEAKRGLTIGRSPELCEFVIDDESLSYRHARLIYIGDALYVEDVNSLNGTMLNDRILEPFKPTLLNSDKTLTLGDINLSIARV
jgi:hypothetical protein